ncbi:MAG TPA: hypothetical protein VHR45_03170 [Thermoanaerobaculia bacterium]|nr:hypothetical protein [Thermoanaerobaculia bacterium]
MSQLASIRAFVLGFASFFAVAAGTALLRAEQAPGRFDSDLRLERRLLTLDLTAYNQARARERATFGRLDEAQASLDKALGGDTLSLGTLETLVDGLTAAREAARVAMDRVDRQLERVEERMRRIAFLEGEGSGKTRATLAGRWRVRILPQDSLGVFELRLDVTVVSGRFKMDGGAAGSLRGTFANGILKLDRIDARGGADSSFLGTVDLVGGRIDGSWQAKELATGEPPSGQWNASRIDSGGAQKP